EHKLLPDIQTDGWEGFWNSTSVQFGIEESDPSGLVDRVFTWSTELELLDDGKRLELTIWCLSGEGALSKLVSVAHEKLSAHEVGLERVGTDKCKIRLSP